MVGILQKKYKKTVYKICLILNFLADIIKLILKQNKKLKTRKPLNNIIELV
jgi:hypothetical protein